MRFRHTNVEDTASTDTDSCTDLQCTRIPVDPRMAVTYLPGCVWLLKAIAMCIFLAACTQLCAHKHNTDTPSVVQAHQQILAAGNFTKETTQNDHNTEEPQCSSMWRFMVLCAMCLFTDSVLTHEMVFDGNGLLWTMLMGFCVTQVHTVDDWHNFARGIHTFQPFTVSDLFMCVIYILQSCCLVCACDPLGRLMSGMQYPSTYMPVVTPVSQMLLALYTVYMQPPSTDFVHICSRYVVCACALFHVKYSQHIHIKCIPFGIIFDESIGSIYA